jgi:hypothetical protein
MSTLGRGWITRPHPPPPSPPSPALVNNILVSGTHALESAISSSGLHSAHHHVTASSLLHVILNAMCINSHITSNKYFFSSFNDVDPSHMMLVDCCVLCCRGCGPTAAVWSRRPPWSIKFDRILPSFFYLGTHVTTPPTPSPTRNQSPIRPNISANIRPMRTFQVTILCACMVGRRLCRMVAHIYCHGVGGSWWSSKTRKKITFYANKSVDGL